MSPDQVHSAVGVNHLPEPIRKLGILPQLHYADVFTLTLPNSQPDASPEQWARAMFGDVPNFTLRLIWHHLLRFPLQEERSPALIGGSPIERGEEWVRIENSSSLLDMNLIVHKTSTQVTLVTMLQYKSWVSHIWWPILSFFHRTGAPKVLRRAARRIEGGS